ncbi:MAG: HEPN domain-containing protein [Armatimonadota bacterium]|nr:HEPN domain-containing protein [Armatimonadota bacterium]
MNEEQAAMVGRARSALRLARVALREDEANAAASQAYYAMFHAANAALASLGLGFSKHSAVQSAFGREFAKTGRLPRQLHRWLISAFEKRVIANYDYTSHVEDEEASEVVEQAEQFIAAIEDYLREQTE